MEWLITIVVMIALVVLIVQIGGRFSGPRPGRKRSRSTTDSGSTQMVYPGTYDSGSPDNGHDHDGGGDSGGDSSGSDSGGGSSSDGGGGSSGGDSGGGGGDGGSSSSS